MSEALDPQVIRRTQDLLGKYVKKPPLTPKLLGKPPFRYIHDILSVVISQTGFLKGLYTPDELSSDNIKDKEAKIKFLQKSIDATSLALGEPLSVRPSKIVAGHEVEKTNEWLQAIATAISKKVNSDEAVKQVVSGVKTSSTKKASSEAKGKSERNKEVTKLKKDPGIKETKPGKSSSSKPPGSKTSSSATKAFSDKNAAKISKRTKEGPSRSAKKDEDKRKSSKTENGREEKPKKEKTRASDPAGPSRASSRMDKREEGKENSPPAEKEEPPTTAGGGEEVPEQFRNGHDSPAEKMLRLKSRNEAHPEQNLEEANDDFFEANLDEGGPTVGISSEELVRTGSDGPNNPVLGSGSPPNQNDGLSRRGSSSFQNDPAIMKALGADVLVDRNGIPVAGLSPTEPNDSGVGSLESPKNNSAPSHPEDSTPNTAGSRRSKAHSPSTQDRPPTEVPATPMHGPSPLKAYHPDLSEESIMPSQDGTNSQEADPIERPRTGMSIRPRTGRRSARPVSARPAPPKVRERREIPQEEIPRPPTGRPTANVILDAKAADAEGENDDDDHFTVGETKPLLDDEALIGGLPTSQGNAISKETQELLEGDQEAKGILVAQILETKKELEDDRRQSFSPETPGHRRVPLEQALPGDINRRKEKELIRKDVEKLTNSIQSLTRSVNPLAKMLDYLQEDLDSMQSELDNWRKENKTLSQNLKAEETLTEQALTPLKAQLSDLEEAIYEQREKMSALKSNILRNEKHFLSLMGEA